MTPSQTAEILDQSSTAPVDVELRDTGVPQPGTPVVHRDVLAVLVEMILDESDEPDAEGAGQ